MNKEETIKQVIEQAQYTYCPLVGSGCVPGCINFRRNEMDYTDGNGGTVGAYCRHFSEAVIVNCIEWEADER